MTRYEMLVKEAIDMLNNNDELFCDMIDGLDSYNDFADGFKCWDMNELDDFYNDIPATTLINEMTKDFNINDNWFYFTIYGLESTDSKIELYRDSTSPEEVFDEVIDKFNHIYFYDNDFEELINNIVYYEEEEEETEETAAERITEGTEKAETKTA